MESLLGLVPLLLSRVNVQELRGEGVRAWRPEVAINLLQEAVGNRPVRREGVKEEVREGIGRAE